MNAHVLESEIIIDQKRQREKQEIQGLIETLKGDRIGLIEFSGAAFVQCPLTTDYSALQLFLNDIKCLNGW